MRLRTRHVESAYREGTVAKLRDRPVVRVADCLTRIVAFYLLPECRDQRCSLQGHLKYSNESGDPESRRQSDSGGSLPKSVVVSSKEADNYYLYIRVN